jgi:zinc protease
MGGRLFEELREKRSLAYSVYGSPDAGFLSGVYQVYIGCAPAKVEDSRKGLLRVLDDVVRSGISVQEVDRAKTYMIGLYKVGSQSNRSLVHSYARYELGWSDATRMEKFQEMVRAVTMGQIREAAKKYFATDRRTWVLLVPKKS